jgi:phosphoglycerate kinase
MLRRKKKKNHSILMVTSEAVPYAKAGGLADAVSALAQAGLTSKITHVSTGGGASLEFMAGKSLPGVDALSDASASTV